MDFLIVGNGMFGAATARYLTPHATVTVAGAEARGRFQAVRRTP